ncbi:MAG: carbohydrate-binding protein, partial [Fibrobacteraceae bacterium]|nr:carbohydrate-binding protein [Fibrobacteraceae bacterium]
VASANATSSFQLSLDGEPLTDVISVPQNEGEENYDDYNKVNANVTLPSGEHILRFTVVGDWMDVDYFTFVKGENAKDPEPIGGDSSSTAIENSIKFTPDTESYFDVFDLQGKLLTRIKAMNLEEATTLLKNTSRSFNQGIYLLRGKNTSKLIRLNQVK